jgi:hypothetical protein
MASSAGNDRNRNAEGLYVETKAAPATTHISNDSYATAKGHSAGPSAGVTAASTASSIPAHVTSGNMNVGSSGTARGSRSPGDSAQYNRESERIVEEERSAAEKLPFYPELNERFTLLSKMGE